MGLPCRDGEYVYFYGVEEDYLAANGGLYHVLQPTEVSAVKTLDPVEVARGIIVSRLGEDYTRGYFSDPSVTYSPGNGNNTHVVGFIYRITVGNYTTLGQVLLAFNQDWGLRAMMYEEYIIAALRSNHERRRLWTRRPQGNKLRDSP